MQGFTIYGNSYLKNNVRAYYTFDYYRGGDANTRFILKLKNTFNNFSTQIINAAKQRAETVLLQELSAIIKRECLQNCVVVAVPRAKDYNTYFPSQLCLIEAISNVAQAMPNVTDGAYCVVRNINTVTTHLQNSSVERVTPQGHEKVNGGDLPYVGITKATCNIDSSVIQGQTVILVDDIYTLGINVDEDCIQALYDSGAKEVIFYSFAKTVK